MEKNNEDLRQALTDLANALVRSLEVVDTSTGLHSRKVSQLSIKIAEYLHINKAIIEELRLASILHDIGKINPIIVPALRKAGPLSTEEYECIKQHPVLGEEILSKTGFFSLEVIGRIVRSHHERWDGKGYPDGLTGKEIPLGAQIIAVANAYVAMTSVQPYRRELQAQQAADEIVRNSGEQFSPKVVKAFMRFYKENLNKERYTPHL